MAIAPGHAPLRSGMGVDRIASPASAAAPSVDAGHGDQGPSVADVWAAAHQPAAVDADGCTRELV